MAGQTDDLNDALARLRREGTPQIAKFAAWAARNPSEIAFSSIRDLARAADVNANTVYRFSVALGYPGFDACRRAFQRALVGGQRYSDRAQRLVDQAGAGLVEGIRASTTRNVTDALSPDAIPAIKAAARKMVAARRVFCIGVRSSFALAHYLSYTGRMAFPNIARPVIEAGSILDEVSHAGRDDAAVLITFAQYSSELIRAHRVALDRGVQIIAITDDAAAPIAEGAHPVFRLPMAGPQTLPSFTAGFALAEAIVGEMIAIDPAAPDRIAQFERQLADHGGYAPTLDRG